MDHSAKYVPTCFAPGLLVRGGGGGGGGGGYGAVGVVALKTCMLDGAVSKALLVAGISGTAMDVRVIVCMPVGVGVAEIAVVSQRPMSSHGFPEPTLEEGSWPCVHHCAL